AQTVGDVAHGRGAAVAIVDVDHFRAKEDVEQRVRGGMFGTAAVDDEHRVHAELHGGRGRHARVIRLQRAGGEQRVEAVDLRTRAEQCELADLVAAERESDRVVALDEELRSAAEHARQRRHRLHGGRQRGEHQRRDVADRAPQLRRCHTLAISGSAWKQMVTEVPTSTSLSIQTYPPLCLMIPYTVDRPSPLPLPTGLVVKNGSNARARVVSSMPAPLSRTTSDTYWPGLMYGRPPAMPSSTSMFEVLSEMVPPSGIAYDEFNTRLTITWSICPGSTLTFDTRGSRFSTMTTFSRTSRRSIACTLRSESFRLRILGCRICRRLKASSCCVRLAARRAAFVSSSSGS